MKYTYQDLQNKMTFTKTYKGKKYSVVLEFEGYSNSHNWGHKGYILFDDGVEYQRLDKHITYYNRTWESYNFQSLIHKLIYSVKADDELKKTLCKYVDKNHKGL